MTKQRRRSRRSVKRDVIGANHNRLSRHDIPSGVDPATRLAAVKAAATRNRSTNNPQRITTMHDSTRADLVQRLQRLTSDERAELMDAAAAENKAEAGKEAAAQALSDLLHPNRKA